MFGREAKSEMESKRTWVGWWIARGDRRGYVRLPIRSPHRRRHAGPTGAAGGRGAAPARRSRAGQRRDLHAQARRTRVSGNDYRLRRKQADAEELARKLTAVEAELRKLRGGTPSRPPLPPDEAAEAPAALEARADLLSDQARRLQRRPAGSPAPPASCAAAGPCCGGAGKSSAIPSRAWTPRSASWSCRDARELRPPRESGPRGRRPPPHPPPGQQPDGAARRSPRRLGRTFAGASTPARPPPTRAARVAPPPAPCSNPVAQRRAPPHRGPGEPAGERDRAPGTRGRRPERSRAVPGGRGPFAANPGRQALVHRLCSDEPRPGRPGLVPRATTDRYSRMRLRAVALVAVNASPSVPRMAGQGGRLARSSCWGSGCAWRPGSSTTATRPGWRASAACPAGGDRPLARPPPGDGGGPLGGAGAVTCCRSRAVWPASASCWRAPSPRTS